MRDGGVSMLMVLAPEVDDGCAPHVRLVDLRPPGASVARLSSGGTDTGARWVVLFINCYVMICIFILS